MTPEEILRKHEDANEMHFHEVDRKWIIEAMEEYAINLLASKTVDCHNSSNMSDKPFDKFSMYEHIETITSSDTKVCILMTEKQQTAVQWFVDKLIKGEFINSTDELVEQALEMERGQHNDTYVAAMVRPVVMDINPFNQAEQYFTDTYQTNER